MAKKARFHRGEGGYLWRFLRWTYARWVQIIAHFDLLGLDGRPSQGKLAAFATMLYGMIAQDGVVVILALAAGFGRGTLLAAIASWRGVSAASLNVNRSTNREISDRRAVGAEDGTEPT